MRIDNQIYTATGDSTYECDVTGWTTDSTQPIYIQFTNSNSSSNPTLDINELGAYPLLYNKFSLNELALQADIITQIVFNGSYFSILSYIGEPIPSVSTDIGNDILSGGDGGSFYKEWKNGRDESAGIGFNNGDPVVVGAFTGVGLNTTTIDINSVQVFLNGDLQTYAFSDISWDGADLTWGKIGAGANVVVFWKYKL